MVSRRREGGPELFCSARRLAFPCRLWGLEEPARQQGPARASGPQPLRSVICSSSPLLLSAVLFWLPGPVSQCPLCPQGAGGHTSPEGPHCCTPGTRLGSGSPWETSGGLGGGRWWGGCPHSGHQDQKPLLSPSPSIRTGAHPQIPPHRAGPSRQHLPGLLPIWNAHPACHFPPAPSPSLHLLQAALALPPRPGTECCSPTTGPAQLALSCPCRRRLGGGGGDPPRVTATHQACGFLFTSPRRRLHWEWGLRW